MTFNPYKEIIADLICGDIKKALDNNILAGAVILTYSAIDAMAFLAMSSSQKEVKQKDFIDWVDKYMMTSKDQPYQYKGIDLYGARCGIVHRYGVESKLSESGLCKIFSYHNGSEHSYNPAVHKDFVLLSVSRLVKDFFKAVRLFMQEIESDKNLKSKVDARLTSLFFVSRKSET